MWIIGIIGSLLFALTAHAQADRPDLRNRNWDLGVFAAGATGEENTNSFSEAQMLAAGVYVGRTLTGEIGRAWWLGRFEFGADLLPVFVQFTPERIYGIAFDPVILRWNSSLRRGGVTPFIELGGGGLHSNANLPKGNTSRFNFIARGGGGMRIAIRRAQAFEVGCRWWHISNANLGARNPEFNGIQVSVGWYWRR